MASITLTSVRDLVRLRGDMPKSQKFDDDYLNDEIQTAWTALHRLVEDTREGYFDKDGTVVTVAGTRNVSLPTDCRRVKALDILDSTDYRELRQMGLTERNRYGEQRDMPVGYRISERGIELYPTPGAVYTLRVTYSRKVTALGASAVEVDEEWRDFVVWSAILKIATSEERPTGDYQNAVDRAQAAVVSSAAGRRQQEPEYIPLCSGPSWWWGAGY